MTALESIIIYKNWEIINTDVLLCFSLETTPAWTRICWWKSLYLVTS